MSQLHYMGRTLLVVIPAVILIGFGVSFGNHLQGMAFWITASAAVVLGTIVGILSAVINYRRFVAPISKISTYIKSLEHGDMTQRLDANKVGELKPVVVSLTKAVEAWSHVLQEVQGTSKQITHHTQQLSQSAQQTTKATEHIADIIEEVAERTDNQMNGVQQTSNVVAEMSTSLSQASVSTEQVTTSVIDSLEKANNGSASIQTAGKQMNSIQDHVDHLSSVVKGLGHRSHEIGKIVEVINGIAAQTNLLALNAAIEAARAGEQGKGFAVVANEVRNLAEQSAQATLQISQLIAQIQQETDLVVQSMDTVQREVTEGMDIMNEAGHSFAQIQDSVKEVNGQITQVAASISYITNGTFQVVQSMNGFSEVAAGSSSATQSVLAVTEQQVASMQEISSSAMSLANMA
ncbi:MAG: methyl-accepting chemotaxis protein, partial [Bacillota bacterium]|nr:methyl-accepting chemotaxis protein [Bacillota bacterium]